MGEAREYQQKMLKSKKRIVFCNWDRGSGKTYGIFNYMLINSGNYTVICDDTHSMAKVYIDKLEEWKHKYSEFNEIISSVKTTKDEIRIEICGSRGKTWKKINIKFESNIINLSYSTDCVVFDEYIPNRSELQHALNIKDTKIFIMNTLGDIDYITDKVDLSDFYEKQIEELKIEYSTIPKKENTTKTRESILSLIEKMEILKSRE